MKEERLVSIVVPVYNADSYLEDCIDSILKQTYKNIEIILIDDGSRDNSLSICKKYQQKDFRIKVFHQKNKGVSNARNKGIDLSSGSYILFIDSDDIISPIYVDSLIGEQEENALTACRWRVYSNIDEYSSLCSKQENLVISKKDFINLYQIQLLNSVCCKMYLKSKIIENKIYFQEDISLGEDLLFNLSYLKNVDRVIVNNELLYYYRVKNDNSLTGRYRKNIKENQLYLIDALTEFFKDTSDIKLLNKLRMEMLLVIINNELKKDSCSFVVKYKNIRKILNDKEIKKRITLYKEGNNTIKYKLLKYNLFLIYKIVNKFI